MGETLSQGKLWEIKKAQFIFDKNVTVAVKILKISNIHKQLDKIYNEIITLKNTDHPNILKLIDVFFDLEFDENGHIVAINQIYLVLEYFPSQNLLEYLTKKQKMREEKVMLIVSQILEAVKYLHLLDICHRNLQLENILIDSQTMSVKIFDFGFSRKFSN